MGKLDRKVAIVTGGASGIGQATVERFVAEGAEVVVADIQDEAGQILCESLGEATSYIHTDVSQEEAVKAMIDHALEIYSQLDCRINNLNRSGNR